MTLNDFIITVFCLLDDDLQSRGRLRQRGPTPQLADSEVLTLLVVGEYLGIDTDQGLYEFFGQHYGAWFPALPRVHRTTLTRQATNLWAVMAQVWQTLVAVPPLAQLLDSVPVPLCRFRRARRCRRLREVAAYGFDPVAQQTFFGCHLQLRLDLVGRIRAVELLPANVSDITAAPELLPPGSGVILADRGYASPTLQAELAAQGTTLATPARRRNPAQDAARGWTPFLTQLRRTIETVFSQLTARYHLKRVWARDRWHLTARILRKILSHVVCVHLNLQLGRPPLQLDGLVTT